MSLFFSRKMYRELTTSGSTTIRYRRYDGSLSEPIQLYVVYRFDQARVFVNSESRLVTQLYLRGGYAKDHLTRTQADNAPEMIDESDPLRFAMNRFAILDDPRFPLVEIVGARFQTAIPGRVTSRDTGLGVPDASVKVEGTDAAGTSWGDGRILLPIIKEPFRTFTVTAEAPGYAPFRGEFDFSQTNAFPLKIELTPQPAVGDYVWVTAKSFDALAKVDDPRLSDVVRRELAGDTQLAALVPLSAVEYGASEERAFLLFDNRDFSFVGVGEDGLHASSDFLGGVAKDWFKSAWAATRGKAKPYQVPQGVLNYYFGHIAAWYVYSAGRLDAVADMINGKSFEDLGHAQAISRARQWIDGMCGLLKTVVVGKPGVDADMYRAGFLDALKAFDSNPAWRGQ
jgi:hypothetical protein